METLNTSHEEEHSIELELEKTKITAPFDGLIARRYVREGQNVIKGDRLFWVTAESPLLLRFTLCRKTLRENTPGSITRSDLLGRAGRTTHGTREGNQPRDRPFERYLRDSSGVSSASAAPFVPV